MKKTIFLLFLSLVISQAIGQTSPDSISDEFGNYINYCFDDLKPNEYFDTSLVYRQFDFCSLAILTFLDVPTQDSIFYLAIFDQVKQIAQKFYERGTPILIVPIEQTSFQKAKKLNEEQNRDKIKYISFGNSCLSSSLINKGIQVFNLETERLIKNERSILNQKD